MSTEPITLTPLQNQAFDSLLLDTEKTEENKVFFQSLDNAQCKLIKHIPEQFRTINFIAVLDKHSIDHFIALSKLPEEEQTPETLKHINNTPKYSCSVFTFLPEEEQTLENLKNIPHISKHQLHSFLILSKTEQTFKNTQNLPEPNSVIRITFAILPEEDRTLENLINMPAITYPFCNPA